ncbi:hypothetical protein AB0F11_30030 [Streptomyces sp. NPDC032472]|uniref:effector-associated constant component EACC1 n=1 Tax=Streptomyces sp. NPDC032472 TaxID=3155018 RepID=UPI0033FEBF6A
MKPPSAPGAHASLSSGSAGAVLVRSLTTWLTQRRADVKVTVTAAGGRRVSVDVRRTSRQSSGRSAPRRASRVR